MLPTSEGIFEATSPPSPTSSATWRIRRAQPQGHVALPGPDEAALVLDHLDQGAVGDRVRLFPGILEARGADHLPGPLHRDSAQAARGGARDPLDAAGEDSLQLLGDVDVGVELIDRVVGERVADLVLVEQLAAGVDPLACVERLPLDPGGEDREHGQNRGGDDQRLYPAAVASSRRAACLGHAAKTRARRGAALPFAGCRIRSDQAVEAAGSGRTITVSATRITSSTGRSAREAWSRTASALLA